MNGGGGATSYHEIGYSWVGATHATMMHAKMFACINSYVKLPYIDACLVACFCVYMLRASCMLS
jgi:hypothetical protein